MAGNGVVGNGGIYPRGFSARTDWRWPLVKSEKLVTLNYGKALRAGDRRSGQVPVYGTNGQCGWHDRPLANGPGIILGRKGQGPLGVEWCDSSYWVIDTAYFVTQKADDLDLRYFYYLVKYIGLNHLKDGTSNPSLSRDTFADLLLPLPPLSEQKAIAEILGALDAKIELNRRMNLALESLARSLFKSWFVDFDPIENEPPDGWTSTTIGQFIDEHGGDIQTGPFGSQLHASDYVDDGVPVIMPKQLAEDRVSTDGIARIRDTDAVRLSKHRLLVGDIVQSRRGDVERLALVTDREVGWLCGTGCIRTRINNEAVDPHYLFRYLSTPSVRSWIVMHALGSTMPNLNTAIIAAVPFVLPPNHQSDQRLSGLKSAFALRAKNEDESETLAAVRDTLRPRLLSGGLRVADAERFTKAVSSQPIMGDN